jgi:hypothetical protein
MNFFAICIGGPSFGVLQVGNVKPTQRFLNQKDNGNDPKMECNKKK